MQLTLVICLLALLFAAVPIVWRQTIECKFYEHRCVEQAWWPEPVTSAVTEAGGSQIQGRLLLEE